MRDELRLSLRDLKLLRIEADYDEEVLFEESNLLDAIDQARDGLKSLSAMLVA